MKEEEKEELECAGVCENCVGCSPDVDDTDILDDGIITFTDEQGEDVKFEILDVIAMDSKEYLVVLPVDEQNEDEEGVLILEIKEENGEEVYDTVVDDEEAEKVFKKFEEDNELDDEEQNKLADSE